ncbi:transcription factor bHLH94-like isoform X1 [Oryza glaberrima]|uniref:BHLH domain-containing protein n=1 Tax=Oryza glaberrima TaxID=4538 RepID=I1QPP0_ORYGL|nr:transcription factor bHLH94-like isoform X1 [Oryza glaberrima]XP_052168136.1 transcription factor bHLH94-like isoform X1 [Oryza glaberrima]
MALEAVLLSRGDLFGRRRCAMEGGGGGGGGGGWSSPFSGFEGVMDLDGGNWDAAACSSMLLHGFQEIEIPAAAAAAAAMAPPPPPVEPANCAENAGGVGDHQEDQAAVAAAATAVQAGRRKRRRARAAKNKEEVESQRMTHIAVERNRRKQMNEYLAVLRSLMPPSYAQRGDQASIVGGAINFVKELEQLLQSLEARKSSRQCAAHDAAAAAAPFASFFTFPQYSMSAATAAAPVAPVVNEVHGRDDGGAGTAEAEASGSKPSAVADVEVTMVESHANLRVLSRRRPRQLLRLVVALQGHRLTVLHLNMTSAGHMVLYSFSLKVEDDCQLTSVDEIATAAHQIIEKIQEEQGCSLD